MVRIAASTLFVAALAVSPALALPLRAVQPALEQRSGPSAAVPSIATAGIGSGSAVSHPATASEQLGSALSSTEVPPSDKKVLRADDELTPTERIQRRRSLARRRYENARRSLTDHEARSIADLIARYELTQVPRQYTRARRSRETDAATLLSSRFDSRSLYRRQTTDAGTSPAAAAAAAPASVGEQPVVPQAAAPPATMPTPAGVPPVPQAASVPSAPPAAAPAAPQAPPVPSASPALSTQPAATSAAPVQPQAGNSAAPVPPQAGTAAAPAQQASTKPPGRLSGVTAGVMSAFGGPAAQAQPGASSTTPGSTLSKTGMAASVLGALAGPARPLSGVPAAPAAGLLRGILGV